MNEIKCSCTYSDGDNMFCPVHGTLERSKTSVAQPMQNSQTSSSPMTPIQQEAERRWPLTGNFTQSCHLRPIRKAFIEGAEWRDSLAQQEIERLKGLVKELFMKRRKDLTFYDGKTDEQAWETYKQQHNL